MKKSMLRFAALSLVLMLLCTAAILEYLTADKKNRENAVLVMTQAALMP